METQCIIIWARTGSGALILWCSDSGALVYVADRRQVGDPYQALNVGDFVDLKVETVGAMRIGRDLRFRATGAKWVRTSLACAATAHPGPVMSPDRKIARAVGFGACAMGDAVAVKPANLPPANGTGAA